MHIVKGFATLLIAMAIGGSAYASPITYMLMGSLTGNLEDSQGQTTESFVNTPFVWTLTGDTTQVVTIGTHGGPTTIVPAITDTIALDNTVLAPSIPTFFCSGLGACDPSRRGVRGRWLCRCDGAGGHRLEFARTLRL
jgi:hypothetical protein